MQLSDKNTKGNVRSESVGVAVEDKEPNSRMLKVYIPELTPYLEGTVGAAEQDKLVTGDDNYSGKVTTTNTVDAIYGGTSTNRLYPPDVKANEQVRVFSYGDSDLYYWDSIARNDNLRRLERVTQAASDVSDTPPDELNDENTYIVELDTLHNKHIVLRTSKSDGEQYGYLIKIDAKASVITICDDTKNEIRLESLVPRIMMRNRDGAFVDLAQQNITIVAPKDILIRAGEQLVIDAPAVTLKNDRGQGATVVTSKNFVVNASNSCVVKSPMTSLQGGSTKIEKVISGPLQATSVSLGGFGSNMPPTTIDVNKGYNSSANPQAKPESTAHVAAADKTVISQIVDAVLELCDDNEGAARTHITNARNNSNVG